MDRVESIGQILNTSALLQQTDVSKSEHVCSCGRHIEPMMFGEIEHWPRLCADCQEKQRLQRVRDDRKEKTPCMWQAIDKVVPPLFRDAHLRNVSARLRARMLGLPPGKGLLLFGPPGVGKTYSMCALMRHYILKRHRVIRVTYEDLCLEIRDTYNTARSEKQLIKRYRDVDKLLIEDVGTTVGTGGQESDFSLRTLLLILDHRLEHYRKLQWAIQDSNL